MTSRVESFLNGKVSQHCGDALAVLRTLPADHFDCVVTSPPYWGLRDYGVVGQFGLERTLGEHLAVMVEVFRETRRVLKPTGTLWLNYGDCYATSPNGRTAAATKAAGNDDRTFRDKPFSTIGPITTGAPARAGRSANRGNTGSDGVRRNFAGGFLKPKDLAMIPNRLAIALQDDGWWVRSEIVWGKNNPMPDSSGRYRPSTAHEKIWLLSKSAKCFYDAKAVALPAIYANSGRASATKEQLSPDRKRNGTDKQAASFRAITETRLLRNYEPAELVVWPISPAPFPESHFATFPPELAARCIKAGCPADGEVLDPFGGAGTTALVAALLGRRATLIELNPEYCRLARARIEAEFMGETEGNQHMVRQLGKTAAPGPLFSDWDSMWAKPFDFATPDTP